MIPSTSAAPLALALLVALAGCSSAPSNGEPSPATSSTVAPAPTGPLAMGESWVLSECRVATFNVVQDGATASQGLPPDHRPLGGDVASLVLTAASCESLARGNHSVLRPFAWSLTTTPLDPMADEGGDAYVRELVVSDPDVAAALTSIGFAVLVGQVEVAPTEVGLAASVAAPGIGYEATSPVAAPMQDASPSSVLRLRGADGTRLFWMEAAIEPSSYATVETPASASVSGGALALGAPGGHVLGQMAGSMEAWTMAFGELDSG
jgi:hypothetical protein